MNNGDMDWRENSPYAICEYDNYFIPRADPNISEKEKQRIIAQTDAKLNRLIEESKRF